MLRVAMKSILLRVIMLRVIMLRVIMLSVVMLNVVAPIFLLHFFFFTINCIKLECFARQNKGLPTEWVVR